LAVFNKQLHGLSYSHVPTCKHSEAD